MVDFQIPVTSNFRLMDGLRSLLVHGNESRSLVSMTICLCIYIYILLLFVAVGFGFGVGRDGDFGSEIVLYVGCSMYGRAVFIPV